MNDPADWQPLDVDLAQALFPIRVTHGGNPIWVFRAGTGYRGVQELCPHDDRSLENARIVGDGTMVRCTYHKYTFKLDTGQGVNCPGYGIAVYDVVEREGRLFAKSPAPEKNSP